MKYSRPQYFGTTKTNRYAMRDNRPPWRAVVESDHRFTTDTENLGEFFVGTRITKTKSVSWVIVFMYVQS